MGTATDTQIKELEEAIKEMKEMPSSLTDKAGSVIQTHSGSDDSIGHTGPGTMIQPSLHHLQVSSLISRFQHLPECKCYTSKDKQSSKNPEESDVGGVHVVEV
jgi:hypothetical protein